MNDYLEELDRMDTDVVTTNEYFNLLVNGVNDLDGNDRVIFLHELMLKVRGLGIKIGERNLSRRLQELIKQH